MDRDTTLKMAADLAAQKQVRSAVTVLMGWLEENQADVDAWLDLIECLTGLNQLGSAKAACENAMYACLQPENLVRKAEVLEKLAVIEQRLRTEKSSVGEKPESKPTSASDQEHTNFTLYPYLGYIQRPTTHVGENEQAKNHNSYGFTYRGVPVAYPFNGTTADAFIVGIFGGSVASQFFMDEHETLKSAIQSIPQFEDREVVILQFAQGSFTQPQQLFALLYFQLIGQRFDLVVNIDGFNEVSAMRSNQLAGVHPAMPSNTILRSFELIARANNLDVESLTRLLKIAKYRARLEKWEGLTGLAGILMSVPIKIMRSSLDRWRTVPEDGPEKAFSSLLSYERIEPEDELAWRMNAEAGRSAAETIVELWAFSSEWMGRICTGIGAQYMHVLQPNQYHWHKSMSDQETKEYYRPGNLYALAVRDLYPLLLARAGKFDDAIKFVDATSVFDGEAETVLYDMSCHFNPLGHELLARFLAPEIAALISSSSAGKELHGSRSFGQR